MAFPLSARAAVVVALLASNPGSAQDAGQSALADAGPMIPPGAMGAPAAPSPTPSAAAPLASYTESVGQFLHETTVQPIVNLASYSGEWVVSGSNAAADAARNAGQWLAANASAMSDAAVQGTAEWIAAGANAVGSATQNTGEWIVSGSNAAAGAAQNAGEWVKTGADAVVVAARDSGAWVASSSNAAADAVQNASQWVASASSAAVASTVGAASAVVSGVTNVEDWSIGLVRSLERHLRVDGEFQKLVKESGFVMSNIKVGLGVIPELDVEFRHERALSHDEKVAFKAKVNEYVSKAPGPLGYFEKLLLRRLMKAGEMSDGLRISELHVDLVPLPGLEIFFDPLRFEEEQNRMLTDAYEFSKSGQKSLESIEARIAKIEAMLSSPHSKQ